MRTRAFEGRPFFSLQVPVFAMQCPVSMLSRSLMLALVVNLMFQTATLFLLQSNNSTLMSRCGRFRRNDKLAVLLAFVPTILFYTTLLGPFLPVMLVSMFWWPSCRMCCWCCSCCCRCCLLSISDCAAGSLTNSGPVLLVGACTAYSQSAGGGKWYVSMHKRGCATAVRLPVLQEEKLMDILFSGCQT